VDFSIILLLPFSAAIAFAICIFAVLRQRPRPRLVWSLALSALLASPVFVGPPFQPIIEWFFYVVLVIVWSAIGTLIGALLAKLAIWVANMIKA
jgi:hypothetical protein